MICKVVPVWINIKDSDMCVQFYILFKIPIKFAISWFTLDEADKS